MPRLRGVVVILSLSTAIAAIHLGAGCASAHVTVANDDREDATDEAASDLDATRSPTAPRDQSAPDTRRERPEDAGAPGDAGNPAVDAGPGVWCGENQSGQTVVCDVATRLCCETTPQVGSVLMSCTEKTVGACKTNGGNVAARYACDDESDCNAGLVCCRRYAVLPNNVYFRDIGAVCLAACPLDGGPYVGADGGMMRQQQLCDPARTDECAPGTTCTLPPGDDRFACL